MADFDAGKHPEDVVQLLDEHHLVVVSDYDERRAHFCDAIEAFLGQVGDTQVVRIAGEHVDSLASFCAQLQLNLPSDFNLEPTMADVVETLRFFPGEPMRRIVLWREADHLMECDLDVFSHLVNAFFAVAAEQEHLAPGMLIVQRVIFTGNSKLGAFADDETSPFRRWVIDDDDDKLNLWEISNCVDQPNVLMYRMDG